jgi:hypothetical protein
MGTRRETPWTSWWTFDDRMFGWESSGWNDLFFYKVDVED